MNILVNNNFVQNKTNKSYLPKNKNNNSICILNNSNRDVFIKNNVAFTGKKSIETKNSIGEATVLTGIVGAEFLIGLGLAVGMAKQGKDATDIFLDKEGYTVNTEDNTLTSNFIKADDDGLFQIKGTGIDINPKRFNSIDSEKGIYKNLDKGIEIDLLKGKYIDPENGIFIDPTSKISTILDGDHFEHIAIPSFSFGSGQNSWNPGGGVGPSNNQYPPSAITREEFIEKYKMSPEQYKEENGSILEYIKPNDDRTMTQKIKDFFTNPDVMCDETKQYDIFGREIIRAIDSDGNDYLTPLPDVKTNEIFKDFISEGMSIQEAAQLTHQQDFDSYLESKFPNFGTRLMVYEGGPDNRVILPETPKYDGRVVTDVLQKISEDGGYYPDPGSNEAMEFFKYQVEMIKSKSWDKPMINWNLLLDTNNDGVADVLLDTNHDGIPDSIDFNGDGIPDKILKLAENKDGNNLFENLLEGLKNFFDRNN